MIGAAVACAVLFAVLNAGIVAVAAHLADPEAPLKVLWDRESLLLDLTETCVGILVAVTCALSFLLLLVALPPVILLQRSLMHQQLAAAARTDPKTGLLNATAWQREADAEVSRALRSGSRCRCCSWTWITSSGSTTATATSSGMTSCAPWPPSCRQQVRESDVVGRFGGEEFTVLLPRTDGAGACRIAERLRSSAGLLSVTAADTQISVTISIGVAELGRHGHDLFELLAAADLALYRAKAAGRNQVRLYVPRQQQPGGAADPASEADQEGDEVTGAYP